MARITITDSDAFAQTLASALVAALVPALTAALGPAQGAPRKAAAGTATKPRTRTFASKADRAAGKGFTCATCGRTGLRTAPKAGSFHTAPDGTKHEVA